MLRAVIIDDEESGVETLKILASRYPDMIKVVASTLKAEEGIELIENYNPDVVFLDISMPAMSGFELLDKLTFKDFKLVFTTAHREYAIEAIKKQAFDYLLKPISTEDYKHCLDEMSKRKMVSEAHKPQGHGLIEVLVKDGIIYIRQKEIVRIEASRSYTIFYLENGLKHVASKNLSEFENKLDLDLFFRCHKSHIVNIHRVQKFVNHNGFFALMSDNTMVDISKGHKETFLEKLKNI